eukprot:1173020-Amphidinium_carterae.1
MKSGGKFASGYDARLKLRILRKGRMESFMLSMAAAIKLGCCPSTFSDCSGKADDSATYVTRAMLFPTVPLGNMFELCV